MGDRDRLDVGSDPGVCVLWDRSAAVDRPVASLDLWQRIAVLEQRDGEPRGCGEMPYRRAGDHIGPGDRADALAFQRCRRLLAGQGLPPQILAGIDPVGLENSESESFGRTPGRPAGENRPFEIWNTRDATVGERDEVQDRGLENRERPEGNGPTLEPPGALDGLVSVVRRQERHIELRAR